jgi:anti-sigma factor (TIGR02949 family)
MADCREVESGLTAYVDGECAGSDRETIEAHLQACPSCRARVASERAAHELLRAKCQDLRGCAPEALRRRCSAQRTAALARKARKKTFGGRRTWVPLSLAATLVVATGVFLLFGWGSSVETYAAQLAVDHLKCFQTVQSTTVDDAATLGQKWQASHGWPLRIAEASEPERLQLVGVRRCGSTKGRVAHIMYRWRGEPLSVYVLNDRIEAAADASEDPDAHDAVSRLGEQEIIWSNKGRTYAVVARAPLADLERVARYVRRRIE